LKANAGGMGAYEEVHAFFKIAYQNFKAFAPMKDEFCSQARVAKLSKVGKFIINLGEFCFGSTAAVKNTNSAGSTSF